MHKSIHHIIIFKKHLRKSGNVTDLLQTGDRILFCSLPLVFLFSCHFVDFSKTHICISLRGGLTCLFNLITFFILLFYASANV